MRGRATLACVLLAALALAGCGVKGDPVSPAEAAARAAEAPDRPSP